MSGHKNVKNTEICVNIKYTLFGSISDESTAIIAENLEEANGRPEVGFEWVSQKDSLIFLRKRK